MGHFIGINTFRGLHRIKPTERSKQNRFSAKTIGPLPSWGQNIVKFLN